MNEGEFEVVYDYTYHFDNSVILITVIIVTVYRVIVFFIIMWNIFHLF